MWRTFSAIKCCVLKPGKYAHSCRITQSVSAERRKDGLVLTTVWWAHSKHREQALPATKVSQQCRLLLWDKTPRDFHQSSLSSSHPLPLPTFRSFFFCFYKENQRQMLPFYKAMYVPYGKRKSWLPWDWNYTKNHKREPKDFNKNFPRLRKGGKAL